MNDDYLKHVNFGVTDEIKQFVHDGVFGDSEYLFIRKVDGKNLGYCSKCNHEYEVEALKHNERGICPVCGGKLIVKLSRYGRKKCFNDACFYYFEKSKIDSNVLICNGYYVSKDYSADYKNPKIDYSLQAIYIFEGKKATMLKHSWYSNIWETRSSVFDFNQGWLAPKMCHCSFESIEKAIQGTSFQYIPYKVFQGHYSMVKLFREYSKYPWIEQISKIGLTDIIKAKLTGNHMYNCLNYRGKDIFKILKLSRKDIKDIRESKEYITPLFLSLYQLQSKDKSGLTPAEVKNAEEKYRYHYPSLINILKHTTMKKALKYMKKQYKNYTKKFYSEGDVATTWSDYINDCIKLEMDLSSEQTLFPKDVCAAHQNTIKQVKIKADKQLNIAIGKRLKALDKYSFEKDGLIIRPALDSLELLEEGNALHHCVGGYAEKYSKGITNIFFIRKVNEIDKPFYTLEFRSNAIIQVRGKNNCSPTKEVQEFVDAFKTKKLNKKKAKVRIPA